MGLYFKNFGIEHQDENAITSTIKDTSTNIRTLRSYNAGETYINYEYGRMRLSQLTAHRDGTDESLGTQMHAVTNSVWRVRLSRPGTFFNDGDTRATRLILAEHADSRYGEIPIHVINPDILPGYAADEILALQVAAFPEYMEYYATREAFLEAMQTVDLDNLPAETLPDEDDLPSVDDLPDENAPDIEDLIPEPGYLASGHTDGSVPQCIDEHWDITDMTVVILNAVAKEVRQERLPDGRSYFAVTVDTELGELEIIHSETQVPEEQRADMVPGAIVHCACHLVADPAIGEYEHGAIFDEEHDLDLLRHVMSCGDAYRLRDALADDAVYTTHDGKDTYTGADNIVEWLTYVKQHGKYCDACIGTVTASLDDRFRPGERCVALIYEAEFYIYSLVFAKLDPRGRIISMNNVSAERIACELELPRLTAERAVLVDRTYGVRANALYREYYQSALEITRASTLAHDAAFELLPALIVVANYAATRSGRDGQEVIKGLWIEAQRIDPDADSELIRNRCDFISTTVWRTRDLRCEWCVGDKPEFGDHIGQRCAAVLGDILYNPACVSARDYRRAPGMTRDASETEMFEQNVMRPLMALFDAFYEKLWDM